MINIFGLSAGITCCILILAYIGYEFSLSIFIITAGLTFILAVITVGYRSLKAARANPVNTLRYE